MYKVEQQECATDKSSCDHEYLHSIHTVHCTVCLVCIGYFHFVYCWYYPPGQPPGIWKCAERKSMTQLPILLLCHPLNCIRNENILRWLICSPQPQLLSRVLRIECTLCSHFIFAPVCSNSQQMRIILAGCSAEG